MGNAIGFRRNIYLDWMDAAAAYAAAGAKSGPLRTLLDPIVAYTVKSDENRAYALTILTTIWSSNEKLHPALHTAAIQLFSTATDATDRLWLHYGMTMLAYPFFHQAVRVIGQQVSMRELVSAVEVKRSMIADRGHLGGLETAIDRVLFSLRNWGILHTNRVRGSFTPVSPPLPTANPAIETWLLAVALTLHVGEEIPYLDLLRMPEHFPFRLTITLEDLRRHPWFEVQRQGAAIDMVRLAGAL